MPEITVNKRVNEGSKVKALVCGGPGKKTWQDVRGPKVVHPSDDIVQVDTASLAYSTQFSWS